MYFRFQVYSIPSAYVHMIWGNQYNSYNLSKPGCMVNISYNVVVNTNTVNKQANTHIHAHKTIYVSQLKLHKLKQ